MQQELFRIGGLPIYGYGVMLVVGFFAALQLAKYLARRFGIDPEIFVNAGLIALVAGVAGARLSHVLENLGTYTDPNRSFSENFWDAVNIRSGGLTYYGGFLLATAACIAYGRYKRVSIPRGMDIVAPCLMIGLGFGRIGCFLNGCCHGGTCDVSWAPSVQFPYGSNAYVEEFHAGEVRPPDRLLVPREPGGPPALLSRKEIDRSTALAEDTRRELLALADAEHSRPLHPAQVYSTVTAWLIAAILVAYLSLGPPPGRVFAMMLLIEAPSRFVLETLRAEPTVLGPMSFSMVLSVGLFLAGVVLWFVFRPRGGGTRGPGGGDVGSTSPLPAVT